MSEEITETEEPFRAKTMNSYADMIAMIQRHPQLREGYGDDE
ncbi:hypothetical protein OG933_17950 [Streptomyces sp. NBC_00016]